MLIPSVKSTFALGDTESVLAQSAFLLVYAIVSLPAAPIVARTGPARAGVGTLAASSADEATP